MPLERDEGEYGYIAQRMLHGEVPYATVHNPKLPGTFIMYALSILLFGQTASGIHFGLLLVNLASIGMVFIIGRRLLDDICGAAAAVAFAFMSTAPSVYGLQAHATHFVVLFALIGIWTLLKSRETTKVEGEQPERLGGRWQRHCRFALPSRHELLWLTLSGLAFGLAFLMKQPGALFAVWAVLYLLVSPRLLAAGDGRPNKSRRKSRITHHESRTTDHAPVLRSAFDVGGSRTAILSTAFLIPLLAVMLWMLAAGAFSQFWFWTFTYAGKYGTAISFANGSEILRDAVDVVVGPNLLWWLLSALGAVIIWWDTRLDAAKRFLLVALFVCSAVAVSLGLYFRPHYFILLLPVLSLLTGAALSRSLYLLRHDKTIELFLGLAVVIVAFVAFIVTLVGFGDIWFAEKPADAMKEIYHTDLFLKAQEAAEYVKAHCTPGARIAVLGSEPEIYFYSRTKSASPHILMYPLMEQHPFAATMQHELIQDIETQKPEFVVYVRDDFSWLRWQESEKTLDGWWPGYLGSHLTLLQDAPIQENRPENPDKNEEEATKKEPKGISIFHLTR
jgi:hypothetical protein